MADFSSLLTTIGGAACERRGGGGGEPAPRRMGAQGGGPDRGRARGPLSSPLVSRAAGAVCEHESYVVQGKQQPTGTPHREDPSQQGESGRY